MAKKEMEEEEEEEEEAEETEDCGLLLFFVFPATKEGRENVHVSSCHVAPLWPRNSKVGVDLFRIEWLE